MPPLAAGFTARPETAGGLVQALVPGGAVALVPAAEAGRGTRGWPCGKTQLAVYAAESLCRSGEVDLVAWVRAGSRASVLSGYAEAAARLDLDSTSGAEQAAGRLLRWLAATGTSWLLVLDDVRDAGDLDGLWPSGPSGRVLVTASDPAAVPAGADVRMLAVPAFSVREAISYLTGRLTTDPEHRTGALDLVTDLGCEPAALAHAASVIAGTGLTCRDYRRVFTQWRERIPAAPEGAGPAAAITWIMSAEQARLAAPAGGTWPLLILTALLDGSGIPATALTAPAVCRYLAAGSGVPVGPQDVWALVLTLQRAGLVTVDAASDPPLVLVSAALQAAVRAVAPAEVTEQAIRTAACALGESWPQDQARSVLASRLRSCAACWRRHAGGALLPAGGSHPLLWLTGQSLDAAGMPGAAASWWRQLAVGCERIYGPDHPDTLAAAGQLATALLAAGQAADAVSCSEWVLDGRVRVFGPDDPVTIAARTILGRALVACGKPGDAAGVLADAALASKRIHGPEDPATLAVVNEYAAACLAAGNTGEAISEYRRLLDAHCRLHGPQHATALATEMLLGATYLAAGQAREAITVYQRVLSAAESAHGAGHPDTLSAGAALASALSAAGRIGEALRLHEGTCAACEAVLGTDHPDALARRADLARAYWAAGQAQDALTVIGDAITRSEQVLPPGDPLTQALRDTLTELTGG
jgi:tetratricopeptide (TPR) repeat protein